MESRTKFANTRRSKKDTSPRKKPLAHAASPERYYKKKEEKPKRSAATAK